MTERKQSKIPSFKAMLSKGSRRKPPVEKPSSLSGECSSGGAGGAGDVQAGGKPVNHSTANKRPGQGIQTGAPSKPAPSAGKVTDYVLGPLQMHCLREFAAGRCDRLEITPAYKVPFIEGVSIGRPSENRDRPAVMRCERRIYSRKTGAFAYVSLRVISGELRASRCSASIERESGFFRYDDEEDSGEF